MGSVVIAISSGVDFQAELVSMGLPAECFGRVLAAFWQWAFAADVAGSGQQAAGSEEERRAKDRERKRRKRSELSAECPRTSADADASDEPACRDAGADARAGGVCVISSSEELRKHTPLEELRVASCELREPETGGMTAPARQDGGKLQFDGAVAGQAEGKPARPTNHEPRTTNHDAEEPRRLVQEFHRRFMGVEAHEPTAGELGHAKRLLEQFSSREHGTRPIWDSLDKALRETRERFPLCRTFGGLLIYLEPMCAAWKPPRQAVKRIKSQCRVCGHQGPHAIEAGVVTCAGCERRVRLESREKVAA
jgi:hypothetical protein